jgi:DNA adenine methylase
LAIAELRLATKVVMVERDPAVAAVWRAIVDGRADELAERVLDFELKPRLIQRVIEGQFRALVDRAFQCLVRNRLSRGGVMAPGAGLLNRGENDRGIGSRW